MPRLLIVASIVLVALVVGVPSSQAGTVSASDTPSRSLKDITFVSKPGEANAVEVLYYGPNEFTDLGAVLTAGPGCVSLGPNSAYCGVPGNVTASLGNRDDTALISAHGNINVWAGAGSDKVGVDSFAGGASVYGEQGNDEVSVVGEGYQFADGGPGDDTLDIHPYIGESLGYGGPGDDTITYRALGGNPYLGPITLDGGNGADSIIAEPPTYFLSPSTISGGNGDDTIELVSAPFFLAPFTINGGAGHDAISDGSLGDDTVDGGKGDDYIDVRGGGADIVTCGKGKDVVLYDASDTIAGDCETALLG